MKINRELQQLIKASNPEKYNDHYARLEEDGLLFGEYSYLKFEYGSICHRKTDEEKLQNQYINTWTIFIRLAEKAYQPDFHNIVSKVRFHLHANEFKDVSVDDNNQSIEVSFQSIYTYTKTTTMETPITIFFNENLELLPGCPGQLRFYH